MIRVALATANPDKAREIAAILEAAGAVEVLPRPEGLADVEETGTTLEANALLKARAVAAAAGTGAIADDTGLFVEALDGEPGVFSARFAGEHATYADNVAKLLDALADVPEPRRARFVTIAAYAAPDGTAALVAGELDGEVATSARGEGGFGYDPVFVPSEGDGRTLAELSFEEKEAISHRGRAFRGLAAELVGLLRS